MINRNIITATTNIISKMWENKHNCVLSNAGLSSALTETGIWASIKYLIYWRRGVVGLSGRWRILQNGWTDRVAVWHVDSRGVMGKVCNGSKLAYLVHISIIFDSCIILGMLIKDVMPSIIFDSCHTLGMLIKGVTCRLRRPLRQK